MDTSSETVQKVIQELSLRIMEILPISNPLVGRLKQMIRYGVDDEGTVLLNVLEKFLGRELSAEAFTMFWESFVDKALQAAEHPRYSVLAERLQRGELIPFLGSGIIELSQVPYISSKVLTRKLAEQAEYQNFNGPLSMISQYYQMTEYGRGTLLRTIRESIEPTVMHAQINPLYEILVNIQQPIMIISACYDSQLEQLFSARQKRFVVISHSRSDTELGKILLKYAEKPHPEEPMTAEEVSKLRLFDQGYAIIYKVCGCFELFQARVIGKTARDQRLLQQQEELQQQWDLLSERLSRVQESNAIETDPEERFKLEKRSADIQAKRQQVEQELDNIESELSPQDAGEIGRTVELRSSPSDSVLVSEDDYFAFAKHGEKVIPGYLVQHFSKRSLLFLGHNLSEWQDRLMLNAILERKRAKSERSYAVKASPDPYETAYWKFHGVDVYQVSLKTFVENMGKEIEHGSFDSDNPL